MQNPFIPAAGGVLSADIAVPDHDNEVAFYRSILTTGENPLWRDDLMNNLGTPVIGLGARIPEYEGMPLQWMPHFQVNDIAASVDAALEMGGKELMHGKADDGQSQWAVVGDSDGAAFGLIPVVAPESVSTNLNERQGRISWLSLTVPNAESSRDFYHRVVGWSVKRNETKAALGQVAKFKMQIDKDTSAAEIIQSQDEQARGQAVWLIHLPVDDLAESLRCLKDGGGEIIEEFKEPGGAVVRDPVGVYLALRKG